MKKLIAIFIFSFSIFSQAETSGNVEKATTIIVQQVLPAEEYVASVVNEKELKNVIEKSVNNERSKYKDAPEEYFVEFSKIQSKYIPMIRNVNSNTLQKFNSQIKSKIERLSIADVQEIASSDNIEASNVFKSNFKSKSALFISYMGIKQQMSLDSMQGWLKEIGSVRNQFNIK